MDREGVMIAKLRCRDVVDVRNFSEIAAKNLRYAEIRFERIFEDAEEIELKQESEFFTEFELKLLDLLRGEMDEDEVYRLVVEHYLSVERKVGVRKFRRLLRSKLNLNRKRKR